MRRYLPRILLVLSVAMLVVGACVIRTKPARTHHHSVVKEGKHKKHVKHHKHKKHHKKK